VSATQKREQGIPGHRNICGPVAARSAEIRRFAIIALAMASAKKFTTKPLGRAIREVALFGLCSGLLISALMVTEYRFLVVEDSVEIYGVILGILFAGAGVWLGLTLRRKERAVEPGVPSLAVGRFCPNKERMAELQITPRELEILGLIAEGLSTREIAGRLFVSENTVKTHASRLFEKLGAKRRTQAVQVGKAARLIP
jgi:two-component system, NarL family, response regulator LiaR